MNIFRAGVADIPVIQEIVAETWPVAYGNILAADQIDYMIGLFYSTDALAKQLASGHVFLTCGDEAGIYGFAGYEPDYERKGQAKLHKLYVRPGIQGKGIGRLLLDAVKTASQLARQDTLILNVNRYNAAAIGFYEKHGFTKLRSEDIDIGGGYFMIDYVMGTSL